MSRFDYVEYDKEASEKQAKLKAMVQELESMINDIGSVHPREVARAKASAITNLEVTYMWIGKAVRDEQIARNGGHAPLQEGRTNS